MVVGSGPGGLAAALVAARTVVKATLVERFGCFGGNITAVGVEGFAVINMNKQLSLEVLPMSLKNVLKLWGCCTRKSIKVISILIYFINKPFGIII